MTVMRSQLMWHPDYTPIEDSRLSARAIRLLLSGGYRTVGDVRAVKNKDLLRIKGLGRVTVQEIRTELYKSNLVPSWISVPVVSV